MIKKLYQLFELRKRSHCSIVLGETLTGKSSCLKVLKETLCYLATETDGSFEIVKVNNLIFYYTFHKNKIGLQFFCKVKIFDFTRRILH